jgi:hypothetical protein
MRSMCKSTCAVEPVAARNGIKDIWNAFMIQGAIMCKKDIPLCPTILKRNPVKFISWKDARTLYKRKISSGEEGFHAEALVHFFIDDYRFDSLRTGIWWHPAEAMEVLKHFDGIVTPDYSLCQDFPEPLKEINVYRTRAFGFWAGNCGLDVLNSARWGDAETWDYCNAGIPLGAPVCVGAVASGLKKSSNRPLFDNGFEHMIGVVKPSKVFFYGAPTSRSLHLLRERDVPYSLIPSDTNVRFSKGGER